MAKVLIPIAALEAGYYLWQEAKRQAEARAYLANDVDKWVSRAKYQQQLATDYNASLLGRVNSDLNNLSSQAIMANDYNAGLINRVNSDLQNLNYQIGQVNEFISSHVQQMSDYRFPHLGN